MALKILVADPDKEFGQKAKKYFEDCMYQVDVVSNGRDAQLKMYNEKYFAVILSYNLQNHSGSQVLKFIKTNHPSLKVILTMQENYIEQGHLSEDGLEKLGATETLIPPFELDDVRSKLEGHQTLGQMVAQLPKRNGVSAEEEVDKEDDKFTSVSINEFFASKTILFDVFIKLSSGKYLKILHAGDSFSQERLDKYKNDKKVDFLYFLAADRKKYVRFQNNFTKKMSKVSQINAKTKVTLLKNTVEKFIEDAYCDGVKPLVVDQAKQICETTYELIQSTPDLFKVLREYENFDPNAYSHSFLVTFFASMIVKQFEWESQVTTETVAMACMFHDIGKMKLPGEIVKLKPREMSPEQFEIYKEHPQLGFELVSGNRFITPSVKQIILQHHEASDGTGFPNELRDSKILTLSKIVILANHFVDFVTEKEVAPPQALKMMLTTEGATSKFNGMVLEAFLKVFVDPNKITDNENVIERRNALSNKKSVNRKAS